MEKLGYIVSKRKINDVRDYIGVVNDVKLADPNKPMLIIGFEVAKKYSSNFSILDKKLSDNVFWTFNKTESRDDYENDIKKFYKHVIEDAIKRIPYFYVNILTLKYQKVKKIYNFLFNSYNTENKYIYMSNGMVYLLYNASILGFSLKIMKYCGIDIDKLINKLKEKENIIIYEDDCYLIKRLKRILVIINI